MIVFISGVLIALSLIIGIFICLRPAAAIDLQIRFYEKINWRMQPVSMQKEIRNTKIMGLFLIFLSLFSGIYVILMMR